MAEQDDTANIGNDQDRLMSPLERVGAAIYGILGGGDFIDLDAIARAALVAIREPSEKMVQAAYDADLDIYWAYNGGDETGDGYGPEHAWRVMIDAALAEESGLQVRDIAPGEKFTPIAEIEPPEEG